MPLSLDLLVDPLDVEAALRSDVRAGLAATPKELPQKWLYDRRGSELFDEITRLPEYYPTRTERAILAAHAPDIARFAPDTLIELGSGSSEKTTLLLDAMTAEGSLRCFTPIDMSESFLEGAASSISGRYPGLTVHGLVADLEHHLGALPAGDRRLVVFLGNSFGNIDADGRAKLLADLAAVLAPGDGLLLGTDLVRDPERLHAAYNDTRGVTAAFNRNLLAVLNRELGADFDLDTFVHVAGWNPALRCVEMFLRSEVAQTVTVAELGLTVAFAAGEEIRTEISVKFDSGMVAAELEAAGFAAQSWWTDGAGDFSVSLSTLP